MCAGEVAQEWRRYPNRVQGGEARRGMDQPIDVLSLEIEGFLALCEIHYQIM